MDAFFVPGLQSFDFVKMVRNDEVKDITKLLPANAPNLYKRLSDGYLPSATIDGRVIAVPSVYPMVFGRFAVIREDLREKYNTVK